jgi:NADH-quinone oxidoreductase subunit N
MLQQLDTFVGPEVGWFALSPMLTLLGGTLVLMLAGALTPQWPKGLYAFATATIAGAAGVLAMVQWDDITDNGTRTLVGGVIAYDTLSMFMTITICIGVILVAMLSDEYLRDTPNDGPEIYALYLVAALGGIVMASANDLIVLFLGLETLSLALYVLAASNRRSSESAESGIKYFVLGGFSSAFFLYGIALVYGATGLTNISEMVTALQTGVDPFGNESLALAGIALLIVGLGFKVAAVPFHVWVPDVYQGAPTPVTSFMASVGKVAAFAAMLRVLVIALPFYRDDWRPIIWTLALVTLVVGSVLAVVQDNVKRMLAYSSINHAGFILVGVEAAAHGAGEADPGPGMPSVVLYLILYSVLVIGSFAVVTVVSRSSGGDTSLASFIGARTPPPAPGVGVHRVPARAGRRALHDRVRRQVRRDPGGGRGRQLRDRDHRHGLRGHRRLPVSADHVHDVDVGSRRRGPARRRAVLDRRGDRGRRGVHDRGGRHPRLADRRRRHRHHLRPLTR